LSIATDDFHERGAGFRMKAPANAGDLIKHDIVAPLGVSDTGAVQALGEP